jgi:hypothetical protein
MGNILMACLKSEGIQWMEVTTQTDNTSSLQIESATLSDLVETFKGTQLLPGIEEWKTATW